MEAVSGTWTERQRARVARRSVPLTATACVVAAVATVAAAVVAGSPFADWGRAQNVAGAGGNSWELNSRFLDRCAAETPDGLRLYLSSNRPRFPGDTRTDLDIWVARRTSHGAPWGRPERLPAPINSAADDSCLAPVRDGVFFVSTRATQGVTCGLGDIYFARNDADGWSAPEHLECAPAGPNSALDEAGPSYARGRLYFSRSSAAVPGDLYASRRRGDGEFGPAAPVAELNDAGANDLHPHVRRDGRELVFSSDRTGAPGALNLWVSRRASADDAWEAPVDLGVALNTAVAETHPSLSWDAQRLYFARTPGLEDGDVYMSVRREPGRTGD